MHLMEIFFDFESTLYIATPIIEEIDSVRDEFWRHILHTVLGKMQSFLDSPITLYDIFDALQEIISARCPGEDGLSSAFSKTLSNVIKTHLLFAF